MRNKFISLGFFLLFAFTAFLMPGCGTQHSVGTYTVSYNANGATAGDVPTDPTRYQSDISVTVMGNTGNLQRAGYTFAGWNTNPSGTGTKYTAGQKFDIKSDNAKLYAMWINDNAHTVTYNGNGNTGGSVPTDANRYKAGFIVTVLGNTGTLVKTGFTFAGWNTNAAGTGTNYTQADTFTMGSSNIILYAKWTINPTYTVTYDGNGNTSGEAPVDTTNYEVGESVTVLGNTGNLSKTGCTFIGWNTAADGSGTNYTQGQEFNMGAANVTLYARWSSNPTYSLFYNGNGATAGYPPTDTTKYEAGQTVTVLGNTGNLEKTGYAFGNWNTLADGSGTTYAKGQTFSMGAADTNLYAKWTIINYTVTFDSQGGSAVSPQTLHYGDKVTKPADPTKANYTFAGWFHDAAYNDPWLFDSDVITSDTTLYAKWTVNQYTVSFDSKGGSAVSPETVNSGQKATKPTDPTYTGKTLTGWYKDSDCTESWVFDQDVVTSNITLYAGWTTAMYNVTFDSQGGTEVIPQRISYGGKAMLPIRPTKSDDKALAGWFKDSACTNQWTFTTDTVTMDVTLYAKWQYYSLRDTGPAGGWVFYDKGSYSDGWRYMEAAPTDPDQPSVWGYLRSTGASATGLGSGEANTLAIIKEFGTDIQFYAARECHELIIGDYADWFLPSSDELNAMCTNLYKATPSTGNFRANGWYWSSSDVSASWAGAQRFSSLAPRIPANKDNMNYFRAARYF
jgi:uncharacterized repeat protein (TIGR02543 family)